MAWTAPTVRTTGDLITASIWNTDLVADLLLLKTSINDDGTLRLTTPQSTKVANYTIVDTDGTILGNGTFNVTLPTAAGRAGRCFTIKNIGSGVVTVVTTSAQTIDGAANFPINSQNDSITVQSDGANWWLL